MAKILTTKEVATKAKGLAKAEREKYFDTVLRGDPNDAPNGCSAAVADFIKKLRQGVDGEDAVRAAIDEEVTRP